jgi:RimJ/RimL family protein N-acetyltransferase
VLLETERLTLRPLGVADLDAVIAVHAEPEVARLVASFDRVRSRTWLERCEREWEERGYGLVAIPGRSGFKCWPQFDETEVGWVLHPSV